MDHDDQISGGLRRPTTDGLVDILLSHDDLLTVASDVLEARRSRRTAPTRDIATAHTLISRVFDTLETMRLRCSVLEAEKTTVEQASDALLRESFDRIRELEEVIAGLMRLVSKYDALLLQAAGRTMDAEERATFAELRTRDTERGASDAVEWLYRYMADASHLSR